MFLIIQDKHKLYKEVLNTYYKYKGITIYKDSSFYISLSNGYYFQDRTLLKELFITSYEIFHDDEYETIKIYVYQNDDGINDFNIYEQKDFIISNNINSEIVTNDEYLKNYYFEIKKGLINTNYEGIIVNKRKYKQTILKDGDHIEYLGINIFYYQDFLYINSFNIKINLSVKEDNGVILHYKNTYPIINNYYEIPKNGLKIDKIEHFNEPKKGNSRKLILQIGPTITMSLAMIMMASINVYNSYLNNGSKLSIISLLVMPITMLVSGIMWPVISSSSDNRAYKKEYRIAKTEYLDYLKKYDYELEKRINEYIKEEMFNIFNSEDAIKRPFYINSHSKEFMKITLGYHKKLFPIEIKETKDKEINEHLNRIKYRVSNIDNCPLYLDLKDNRRVTIISKNINYLLNRILLELISKYHYEDLNVAIYSKNNMFNNIFNIPHLFNKQLRFTLNSERQLQDLNNSKLNKPLILLLSDYSEYQFNNPNIYSILFSETNKDILKDSDCVVEFHNNTGVLNSKTKTLFNYYEEEIDFKKYYDYIALFLNKVKVNDIISFKKINPNINIINNYLNNHNGLQADFAVINNEILAFDLHESHQGPHGLIGGSTGSGKSELIISLLLSLVIRYSPDYLNIILIDYKGGGIKESLSYNGKSVPHIIAAINNLENDVLERLIVAIERECKHRQLLFKELANKSSSSIMNIDEYNETNRDYGLEKIAHLLIVVDEFAELKKENPLIIKQLISFSRIGRSLGIHLILATQRPSGVIDDEIWANSHFKIALKVHSEKDSMDIIKSKDAAYLNSPGEFYLQVDDSTIRAKSLYAKKDINNNDNYEVALLNNQLEILNKRIFKTDNIFLESSYYTKLVLEATNYLNIETRMLEFIKPSSKSVNNIKQLYNNNNHFIIGEIDNYLEAKKDILEYSIYENILIYSNRKNEINNLINTLNENKIQTIIISNKKYQGLYISDSLLYEDEEDIKYLFAKLLNDNKTKLNLIIENMNILFSYDEEYPNAIYQLIRRSNISNYSLTLLTTDSNVNFKILNCIKNKVAIEINDDQDLINIFSSKSKYHGSAYCLKEDLISFVPCLIQSLNSDNSIMKTYVDELGDDISYQYTRNNLLIGYDVKTRKEIVIGDNDKLLITSYDREIVNKYRLLFIQNINVKVIEYCDELIKENYPNIIWLGDGLYNQRLFFMDKEIELKNNEAYLYRVNKGRIIRLINHE